MKMQRVVWQSTGRWFLWLGILILAYLNTSIFTANSYNVLGISSDQPSLAAQQKTRATLQTNVTYWQRIVAQHPEYRDGLLSLAALAYQMDNKTEARVYLDRAKLIDPNNPTTHSLERLIGLQAK